MAERRAERDDAGAAGDEQQRSSVLCLPDEVAADRPANLEAVADLDLLDEVRRDLSVVEQLDRDRHVTVLGCRCDRVRALGPVAVLGREADVAMLPRAMPGPVVAV